MHPLYNGFIFWFIFKDQTAKFSEVFPISDEHLDPSVERNWIIRRSFLKAKSFVKIHHITIIHQLNFQSWKAWIWARLRAYMKKVAVAEDAVDSYMKMCMECVWNNRKCNEIFIILKPLTSSSEGVTYVLYIFKILGWSIIQKHLIIWFHRAFKHRKFEVNELGCCLKFLQNREIMPSIYQ